MQIREPQIVSVDVAAGRLAGANGRYAKTLSQLSGLYEDASSYEAALQAYGETPVYEVMDLHPSSAAGDLIFGVTRMVPGKIGREYFLTRGHIHAKANRPEIYYGESGNGSNHRRARRGRFQSARAMPATSRRIGFTALSMSGPPISS